MSLTELPSFEMYEVGSQIRRSSKSVGATIVEGYGRRKYKNEFIRYLIYSIASNDETREHLEILYETKSLKNEKLFSELCELIDHLGISLHHFLNTVIKNHNT